MTYGLAGRNIGIHFSHFIMRCLCFWAAVGQPTNPLHLHSRSSSTLANQHYNIWELHTLHCNKIIILQRQAQGTQTQRIHQLNKGHDSCTKTWWADGKAWEDMKLPFSSVTGLLPLAAISMTGIDKPESKNEVFFN